MELRVFDAKGGPLPEESWSPADGGVPESRHGIVWRGHDGSDGVGVFEMGLGTMAEHHFGWDEIVLIVSGAARVSFLDRDEPPLDMPAGTIATFPRGTRVRWEVTQVPYRNVFVALGADGGLADWPEAAVERRG